MAGVVRQPIDILSLERYMNQNVPELKTPFDVKQFGFGQSNPTYQLTTSDGKKIVLRKKPPGKLVSKTAHRVEREYQIIKALGPTDVPVPEVICLCEDNSVIGTPFYVMEFLDGRHFTDPSMPGVSGEERNALWKSAVETLAKFHRIVPASVGLEKFGKPNGYYDRQIATFRTISRAQAQVADVDSQEPVGELPHFDEMVQLFSRKATQPQDRGTLVHGDYKIDNVIFHHSEARVIGILDWEMATVGHPLSDFCNLSSPWTMEGAEHSLEVFNGGEVPGLPSRDDCIRWYRAVSGYNPEGDMLWGDAFHLLRLSVICQGILSRFATRQASSSRASEYGRLAKPFANESWKRVNRVSKL